MIAFVHMAYEYEGERWSFVDFEDLSQEHVDVLLECANRHRGEDGPWSIDATFPAANQTHQTWDRWMDVEDFFEYRRGYPTRGDAGRYVDIRPSDAFDRLPVEMLTRLASAFRAYLDDPTLYHLEEDLVTVFTPLFEKEVETRR